MANNYKSWPTEVISLVTQISASTCTLESLLDVCLGEGIRRHNYSLIETLLPRLREEAKTIYENARIIRACAPHRPGRPAKWVEVAEEVTALAIKTLNALGDIEEYMQQNYWSAIGLLLNICSTTNKEIQEEIDQITLDSVPEVFLEVFKDE